MKFVLAILVCLLCAPAAYAGPITASLQGCVSVHDPALASAMWTATGTFQAVAFDEGTPGCAPTIAHPVSAAYEFDDDRANDTLEAWIRMSMLPVCGRRQYDLQPYLDNGGLDPAGLKSLVVDTGIACGGTLTPANLISTVTSRAGSYSSVPEPTPVSLLGLSSVLWVLRNRTPQTRRLASAIARALRTRRSARG